MDTNLLSTVAHLSDDALISRVKQLAAREREATAVLIAHLAELDGRRLYLGEGCSSLFTYCTQVLHLSEHAAYGRIEAARAARRFPVILERLEEGSMTLTTVGLLAAHLTEANHRDLLDTARYQSKRQVEELIARLRPQPAIPASVRRLPVPRPLVAPSRESPGPGASTPAPADATMELELGADAPLPSTLLTTTPATSIPTRPATVAPLAPERYKVQFTASFETYEKLRLAQALMRHQIPDGDVAAIFERALTALLEELTKQKFAATDSPRAGSGTHPHSRQIPAGVKRAVWLREGGQCAFVSRTGRRCAEQGFLEFHHVVPYAVGGEATVENIELRCRAHNGYEAELVFGPDKARGFKETSTAYVSAREQPSAQAAVLRGSLFMTKQDSLTQLTRRLNAMGGMGPWKKAPPELMKSFEEVIAPFPGAQPRKMFGYPAAFVNGQMFIGVFQDRLFVRLPESGQAELAKQGGKPFEPMPGRPMREYAEVPPALLRSRAGLAAWVRRAFNYASSLPPKGPARAKTASRAKTARKAAGRKGRL